MKQNGKQFKLWQKVRREWVKLNPPNFQGYWICYLCNKWIDKYELTLDHVIPKSNAINYSARHDDGNLRPCCGTCNTEKGSKVY